MLPANVLLVTVKLPPLLEIAPPLVELPLINVKLLIVTLKPVPMVNMDPELAPFIMVPVWLWPIMFKFLLMVIPLLLAPV